MIRKEVGVRMTTMMMKTAVKMMIMRIRAFVIMKKITVAVMKRPMKKLIIKG